MAPKKKPTTAELLQQALAQIAELRGRVERLEERPSLQIVQSSDGKPHWWDWWRSR